MERLAINEQLLLQARLAINQSLLTQNEMTTVWQKKSLPTSSANEKEELNDQGGNVNANYQGINLPSRRSISSQSNTTSNNQVAALDIGWQWVNAKTLAPDADQMTSLLSVPEVMGTMMEHNAPSDLPELA